jgi:FMN phosphatase YigB (HAD superfamily)
VLYLQKKKMKIVLTDIGGVIAEETYNILFRRLLLMNNSSSCACVTSDETFSFIMKCANSIWNEYKVGAFNEDVFFNRIVKEAPVLVEELNKRGYLISSESISTQNEENYKIVDNNNNNNNNNANACGDGSSDYKIDIKNYPVIEFLKRELRSHHMKIFDPIVDMFLKIRENIEKMNANDKILFAVLSNNSLEWLSELFLLFGDKLDRLFPDKRLVFNSAAIKLAKPDLRAFEYVKKQIAQLTNVSEQELSFLFIDDKLTNVNAAKQVGMKAYQFDATKQSAEELKQVLEHFLFSD